MSKEDVVYDAVERLEWDERKEEDTPHKRLRQFTRRTALTGGAAGIAALMIEACGGSSSSSSSSAGTSTASAATAAAAPPAGIFGSSKPLKFTLVNHVTTNPFFTPTQSGAADACKLLGCTYQWTGSADEQRRRDGQLVQQRSHRRCQRHRRRAGRARRRSIARLPRRLAAKIPVVSYNADEPQAAGAWATSGRTCSSPASRWANISPRSCRPVTSRCSSPRRVRPTSNRGSMAPRPR